MEVNLNNTYKKTWNQTEMLNIFVKSLEVQRGRDMYNKKGQNGAQTKNNMKKRGKKMKCYINLYSKSKYRDEPTSTKKNA